RITTSRRTSASNERRAPRAEAHLPADVRLPGRPRGKGPAALCAGTRQCCEAPRRGPRDRRDGRLRARRPSARRRHDCSHTARQRPTAAAHQERHAGSGDRARAGVAPRRLHGAQAPLECVPWHVSRRRAARAARAYDRPNRRLDRNRHLFNRLRRARPRLQPGHRLGRLYFGEAGCARAAHARGFSPPGARPHYHWGSGDAEAMNTLRRVLGNGRVTGYPTRRTDEDLLLRMAGSRFEFGRSYSEAEVNELLRAWLETFCAPYGIDHVTMRRRLVDTRFL